MPTLGTSGISATAEITAAINAADHTRPNQSESQQGPETLTSCIITATSRRAEACSSVAGKVLLVCLTNQPKVSLTHATNKSCVERGSPQVLHLRGITRPNPKLVAGLSCHNANELSTWRSLAPRRVHAVHHTHLHWKGKERHEAARGRPPLCFCDAHAR